jgi:serine/threonine protein kinase
MINIMDGNHRASKSPQHWEKLWNIFHQANDLNPAEREKFLHTVNQDLRIEVEQLLTASIQNPQSLEGIVNNELALLEKYESPGDSEIKADTVLAGRFKIVRELGRGGMGTVYEAYDQELEASVALKIMQQDLTPDTNARERFHREINLARKVTHPNACRIFDLFQHENLVFLTMELLPGETLQQKIKRDGRLNYNSTIIIVLQVSETLSEMHRLGIVHRDLKTSNILLVPNGKDVRAVVTDFGLAIGLPGSGSFEVTQTGQVLGTPQYMAPEQLKKEPLTAATDIYALGLVMYEMTTGHLPLEGESPLTIAAKRIAEDTPSPKLLVPDLNRKWERIILRCLERNPKHRYQNATEVMNAITSKPLFTSILPARHKSRIVLGISLLLISLFLGLLLMQKQKASLPNTDVIAKRIWTGATGTPAGAVSTNGKILIDIDWEKANVMAIDLQTKKKRLLTKSNIWFHPYDFVPHPVCTLLSPDSKQVAYSIGVPNEFQLRSANITGSTSRTLFRSQDYWVTPFDWSSDGTQIAVHLVHKNGDDVIIGLISAKDGTLRTLKKVDSSGIRKISFSPDVKYLTYDFVQDKNSANHDIFLISLNDGSEHRVVAHNANDYLLGWSPDGKDILFASDRSATNDAWRLRIVDGKPQGTPELIRKDIGQIYPLKITQNGSLYYAHLMSGMDVYTVTLNSERSSAVSPPSRITYGDVGFSRSPAYSRDGNFLIFQSLSNPLSSRWNASQQRSSLKIVSLQSGEIRQVFPEVQSSGGRTRFSPDGQSALLIGSTETDGSGVYSIDLESGKASKTLFNSGSNWARQYHFSPDANFIFYIMNKDGSIIQKEIASGKEKAVCNDVADFDLSFDGRWLAVMKTDIYKGLSSLQMVPVQGGSGKQIFQLAMPEWISSVAWMPDGESVVLSIGRRDLIDAPHKLWRVSKNGGKRLDLGISSEYVSDLRVHPDGKQIAIWTVTDSAEIWVMENFIGGLNDKK